MPKSAEQLELDKTVQAQADKLRGDFNQGLTRPIKHRLAQLNNFMKMMRENKDRWTKALFEDLRKSEFEGYNMEVNPIEHEIQHQLDHIESWMEPTSLSMDPLKHLVISLTGHGKAALYHDPLGVCLVIGAWNYPLHLTLLPAVGAIAAGNAVMIKTPSPKYSPATAALIAELVPQYLKCVEVVEGGREGTEAVLEPRFDHVFFTGGSSVGKLVAKSAARFMTPTVLELGGKSPVIIDKSASLQTTAKRLMWGKFTNAGQTCIAPDHVFVHREVADAFIGHCKDALLEFYGKDPQSSPDLARIINKRAFETLEGVVTDAADHTVLGGQTSIDELYIAPTLVDYGENKTAFNSSKAMANEIFGPVMPFLHYSDLDEVIASINNTEKPLAMYIFTNDYSVSERMLRETSAGHAVVNDILLQFCAPIPFGGVGNSGMGSYHGKWSFETFTHEKGVLKRHPYGEIPARFPPYGVQWKQLLVSALTFPFSSRHINLLKIVLLAVLLKFSPVYSWVAPLVKALLLQFASWL